MELGQAGRHGLQALLVGEAVIQHAQLANAGQSRLMMVQVGQRAHACAGGGHRQCVTTAGDGLIPPRSLLIDQIANSTGFREAHSVQGIVHQLRLGQCVAQQCLG